jgi:hypothetical protein
MGEVTVSRNNYDSISSFKMLIVLEIEDAESYRFILYFHEVFTLVFSYYGHYIR